MAFIFRAVGFRSTEFSMLFRFGAITLSTGIRFPIFSEILLTAVDLHLFFTQIFPSLVLFTPILSVLCFELQFWSPHFCSFYPSGYPSWGTVFIGQLKRQDKLTSIARFWSPENSIGGIFENLVFVFEIWAIEILVFTDSEGFRERTGKYAFDIENHMGKEPWRQTRSLGSLHARFINDNELCSVPDDHWNSSNLICIWLYWIRTVLKKISWMMESTYLLWMWSNMMGVPIFLS